MTLECYICHARFQDHNQFAAHLKTAHGLGSQAYYDAYVRKDGEGECAVCGKPTSYHGLSRGYGKYCCAECQRQDAQSHIENKETTVKCEICGEEITGENQKLAGIAFSTHLKKAHFIYSLKAYYDGFLRKEDEGICPVCSKETNFQNMTDGYSRFCCKECQKQGMKGRTDIEYNERLKTASKIREVLKSIADRIMEKYRSFLKDEKKVRMFDTRGNDRIDVNTVSDEKSVETVDGDTVTVKTEVSCSTARTPNIGTQTRYTPKLEQCKAEYVFDDIINGDSRLDETEWCR